MGLETLVRPPFTTEEFRGRLARLREEASRRGLDALILNSPENIYYLTGFQTIINFRYQVLIAPLDSEPCFVVRYGERSNVWARSCIQRMEVYRDTEDPIAATQAVLQQVKPRRVGIEMDSLFLTPALCQRLVAAMPGDAVEDCSGIVEQLRLIKSAEEIAYIEAAAKVSSAGVRAGLEAVGDERSEGDVAAAVYGAMIAAGGEYPPLPPLVVAGERTTLFHNTWSQTRIRRGDVVFIEVPGVVARYLAPIARTAVLGDPPAYIGERYRVAVDSLDAGVAAMRPGVTCAEVYEAFAAPYKKGGYEIPTHVGYTVGLAFPPRWSERGGLSLLPGSHAVLRPGMVFHTPRTVRVYGDQTPIVSETTLITENGHRMLTEAPRGLVRRG